MEKPSRIKVTEQHDVNKVLKPCRLSSLIKRLQRYADKYGDPEVQFHDDLGMLGHCWISMNMQWETRRWETDAERDQRVIDEAEKAASLARQAELEEKYGSQSAILDTIRERGAAAADKRPIDFGNDVNAMLLEHKLIPPTKWKQSGVPEDVMKLLGEQISQGISTGIGRDEKLGWFVLVTGGQGPALIWAENQ